MPIFLRAAWLLPALCLAAPVAAPQDVPPAEAAPVAVDDPAALVEQLGDPSFRARQQAARQLEGLGLVAKEALLAGLHHRDAEVRRRCQQVLVVVLELDFQQRLDTFARDTEGTDSHGLAGWDRFREMAGGGAAARELFVAMHRAEPGLMETLAIGPQVASEALDGRCREIYEVQFNNPFARSQKQQEISLGTSAAALFVASDPNVVVTDTAINYVNNMTYQQPFAVEIGGPKGEALKRLLGNWIVRTANSANAFQSLWLAMQHGLKEGLVPAEALVRGGGQPQFTLYALLVIGRFGGREHLAIVEPLLDNATEIQATQLNGEDYKTQIRDVALAVAVHLTGQDVKDYGFEQAQANPQHLFNPATLGFREKDDREGFIARYRDWAKEHAEPSEG
jgi:hypothetical protein